MAAAPSSRADLCVMPMQSRSDEEYSGQRISLDFKDADIQNVLRILADVSDLNIITTEDVAGRLDDSARQRPLGPGARRRS